MTLLIGSDSNANKNNEEFDNQICKHKQINFLYINCAMKLACTHYNESGT